MIEDCGNTIGGEKDEAHGGNSQGKKLEDYTLLELLNLKEGVEEEYGRWAFQKHIYPDIVNLFGVSDMEKSDQEQFSKEKTNSKNHADRCKKEKKVMFKFF